MGRAINLKNSQVNILMEHNGMIHMVSMDKEKYESISMLVKGATHELVRTNRTQGDLLNFLTNK